VPLSVDVNDLSFRYPSYPGYESIPLLAHLDLRVEEGCCVRILGPPDCGKTTLARILCGLAPGYTGGECTGAVTVAGVNVRASRPCDLLEHIGIAFQSPDEQFLTTRCSSEVAFPLESLGLERAEMAKRAADALAWAGLEGHGDRAPITLSGGEKRRLLLACLRAARARVWLLDETVDEIDAAFRGRCLRDLRAFGVTVLLMAAKELPLADVRVDQTWSFGDGRLSLADSDRRSTSGRPPLAKGPARERRIGTTSPATPAKGRETLVARGLALAFGGEGSFRLDAAELDLTAGEVVALTGPNGAGKTTLARILCGLLRPQRGTIRVVRGGRLVTDDARGLRTAVGYVFQDPDHQIFLPTIREELAYGLTEAGLPPADLEIALEGARERFSLPALAAPPSLLGYGTRKRIQMAVYYLLDRAVVILDEADAGLTRADFAAAVGAFREKGCSIIAITHDEEIAASLADRVLRMVDGVL
jgi:energy-coupling factor transport system ATP-binding protein